MTKTQKSTEAKDKKETALDVSKDSKAPVKEFGGRKDGPEPTRYGDWELKGKCVDF